MASEKGAQRLLAQAATAMALLVCFAVVLDIAPPMGGGAPSASVSQPAWHSESFSVANAPGPVADRTAERKETLDDHGVPDAQPTRRAALYTPADFTSAAASSPEVSRAPAAPPPAREGVPAPVLPPAIPVAAAPTVAEPPEPDVAGLWMPDSTACSVRDLKHGLLPTIITKEGASAGETFCVFKNRKRTDNGWRVNAQCVNGGQRWTTQVKLTLERNRLVWESKRGRQVYARCDADLRIAAAP
jgi:hypothetical protein